MIKLLKFAILLLPEKEQILSLGNIVLEPIIFNIDFTQIKAFIKFIPILFDFLAGTKKRIDNPTKESEYFEIIEQDIILADYYKFIIKLRKKWNYHQKTNSNKRVIYQNG